MKLAEFFFKSLYKTNLSKWKGSKIQRNILTVDGVINTLSEFKISKLKFKYKMGKIFEKKMSI